MVESVCIKIGKNSQASVSNILLKGGFAFSDTETMCILLALNSVNSIVEEDPWILEERKRSVYVFSTKDYARLKGLSPERTFRTFEEAAYGLLDKRSHYTSKTQNF